MADDSQTTAPVTEPSDTDPASRSELEFEEGRYLFCAVRVTPDGAAESGDMGSSVESFTAEGIDGREVRAIASGDLAAVVQPCESLFDASDPTTVRRWLLRHQSVVDTAGEVFGTPLPFRFDTVVVGGDERVREWLDASAEELRSALESVADHWEYRIELSVEDEAEAAAVADGDDRLADLDEEIEQADDGRAFLLEKQYEERLRDLVRERRARRADDLVDRVDPYAARVARSGRSQASASILGDASGGDAVTVSLSVLATPDAAEAIGEELEPVASEPGVEVRYTGPWPPYTFAPEIDADT